MGRWVNIEAIDGKLNDSEWRVEAISAPYYERVIAEPVRCRDCRYWDPLGRSCDGAGMEIALQDDYCSNGERKEQND